MIAREVPEDAIAQAKRVLERSQTDPAIDRALGSIYGAMIGDALGAYCEFHHSLADETVNEGTMCLMQLWR